MEVFTMSNLTQFLAEIQCFALSAACCWACFYYPDFQKDGLRWFGWMIGSVAMLCFVMGTIIVASQLRQLYALRWQCKNFPEQSHEDLADVYWDLQGNPYRSPQEPRPQGKGWEFWSI